MRADFYLPYYRDSRITLAGFESCIVKSLVCKAIYKTNDEDALDKKSCDCCIII